jgi:Cu-Zn family superoxide dismutase
MKVLNKAGETFMKKSWNFLVVCACLLATHFALADRVIIHMSLLAKKGIGNTLGIVTASDTKYGLLLTPELTHLPAGMHGFHIHNNPSCQNNGMSAGTHFDPQYTTKHLGPYNDNGHLGDLPVLVVDNNHKAILPVLAPRLKVSDIKGHALIIHLHGDNYSDTPEKNGGGGSMLACGVIR